VYVTIGKNELKLVESAAVQLTGNSYLSCPKGIAVTGYVVVDTSTLISLLLF
jgi:hypothetical protein